MKALFQLALIAAALIVAWKIYHNPPALSAPTTTSSHHGTATLFTEAIGRRDVNAIKVLCKEPALSVCESILNHPNVKDQPELEAKAHTGGAAGERTSVSFYIYSANNNSLQLIVFATLANNNEQWLVEEIALKDPHK